MDLTPKAAKIFSQVVGYVFTDGEIGKDDTPFKPMNPVQEVLSKAQHYEAKKSLQSDVTNAVRDANNNFAPSESTQPIR
ncbi:MAG: hypothetical protein IPK10_05505 [Bacteroidetes bacterium]|nr:hypothetical protein [Bacteroidota bacterium]